MQVISFGGGQFVFSLSRLASRCAPWPPLGLSELLKRRLRDSPLGLNGLSAAPGLWRCFS